MLRCTPDAGVKIQGSPSQAIGLSVVRNNPVHNAKDMPSAAPATMRAAALNSPEANAEFCNNSITTSKYTLLSFVPLSLFEQCVALLLGRCGLRSLRLPARMPPPPSRPPSPLHPHTLPLKLPG